MGVFFLPFRRISCRALVPTTIRFCEDRARHFLCIQTVIRVKNRPFHASFHLPPLFVCLLCSVGEELDEDDLDAELACLDDELDVST